MHQLVRTQFREASSNRCYVYCPHPNFLQINSTSKGFICSKISIVKDCTGHTETTLCLQISFVRSCVWIWASKLKVFKTAWMMFEKQWPIAQTLPDQQRSKSDNPSLWCRFPPPPALSKVHSWIFHWLWIVHSSFGSRMQVYMFETPGDHIYDVVTLSYQQSR